MFKENVIILSKIQFKETNLIITFLSPEFGKIKAHLPVAMKFNSKNYFPYNIGDCIELIYKNKNSDWIQIKEHALAIKPKGFNLHYFLFVSIIHEYIYRFDIEKAENNYFFEKLTQLYHHQWLGFNEDGLYMFTILADLTQKLGHQLNIHYCQHCQIQCIDIKDKVIRLNKLQYTFSYNTNGLICSQCIQSENQIPSWFLKLYFLVTESDQKIPVIPIQFVIQALELIIEYLHGCLHIKLASASIFLNEIKKHHCHV